MKILHTADWHLGKLINNTFMTDDQLELLSKIKQIISEREIDVVIVAGDVYDRSIPPVEAVNLLSDFLTDITKHREVKVIMSSGNHDSASRLSFGAPLFSSNGVYLVGQAEKGYQKIEIADGEGEITDFYVIPYLTPFEGRKQFDNPDLKTNDDLYEYLFEKISEERQEAHHSVIVAHGFVIGMDLPEESESERPLSIGGADYISYRHFLPYDYTALGHLHNPQKVGTEHIRYSGSLLKYSFSESQSQKGVVIVMLSSELDGNRQVEFVPIKPTRDMRIIKGPLMELVSEQVASSGNREDYIHAILTDRGELIDPIYTLRSVYPNVLSVEKAPTLKAGRSGDGYSVDIQEKDPFVLFEAFHEQIEGDSLTEAEREFVKACIESVLGEETK